MRQVSRAVIWGSICLGSAGAMPMPSANAEDKFDGTWNGELVTKSGPCDAAYRGAVQVTNGIVQVPGVNALSGRVWPNGSVIVRGSLGENHGVASGRFSANSGRGTWRAHVQNKDCSGVWNAQRQ
jgi:hypothetical protein